MAAGTPLRGAHVLNVRRKYIEVRVKFHNLSVEEENALKKQRDWLIGHFDNSNAYSSISNKLKLIQTIMDEGWVSVEETWKLQSLGVAFGDALVQEIPELFWMAVEDEYGRDPGLRWLSTSVVCFPLTAISKRIEDGEVIDIYDMFAGFCSKLKEAVQKAD